MSFPIGLLLPLTLLTILLSASESRTAGTPPADPCCSCTDVCESSCQDRPRNVTFRYKGGTCEQSDNDQTSGYFNCVDSKGGPPALPNAESYMVATDVYGRLQTFFEGTVKVGEQFTIAGVDGGLLDYNVNLTIYNSSDPRSRSVLQSMVYHTSCSQGMDLDDSFGSTQIKSFVNDMQGETSCLFTPIDSDDTGCCGCTACISRCDHRPKNLTFVYNGGGCEQSDNEQEEGGVFHCQDNPFGATEIDSEVFLVAKHIFGFQTYFEGYIQVNDEFTMQDVRGTKNLASNTNVTIYNSSDVDGKNIIQTMVLHTSCSRDLHLNDVFGGIQLKEFYNDAQGEVRCLYTPVEDS